MAEKKNTALDDGQGRLITTPELAAWLHVSPRTVEGWRLKRKAHLGPPSFFRFTHRCIRYDVEAVKSWLHDCHLEPWERDRAFRVCKYPPEQSSLRGDSAKPFDDAQDRPSDREPEPLGEARATDADGGDALRPQARQADNGGQASDREPEPLGEARATDAGAAKPSEEKRRKERLHEILAKRRKDRLEKKQKRLA